MHISQNPIQYQLQLFGANGAQIGASFNSATSDPFGMAISAVGATVVPEVRDAGSSSSGNTGGDASYRAWAKSLRDYGRAAQGGTRTPADSGSDTSTAVATEPATETASSAARSEDGVTSGGTPTGESAGPAATGSSSTAAPTDNGSTSATSAAQNSYGGLLGLFRR